MPFRFNPFTQKPDIVDVASIPPGTVSGLVGNSGGSVSPDGSGDINVVGSGDIDVVGTPVDNTLTVSYTGDPIDFLAGDTGGNIGPNGSGVVGVVGGNDIDVSGAANSLTVAYTGDPIDFLAGNSGGNIGPDGSGVVSLLGTGSIDISGAGNTLTVSNSAAPISDFIVGPSGNFSTVQSAIDAASAGDCVVVQAKSSSYIENLTLKAGVDIVGVVPANSNFGVIISGQHTLATSGSQIYSNISWQATTTSIFTSSSSGSPVYQLFNCAFDTTATNVWTTTNLTPSVSLMACKTFTAGGGMFSVNGGSYTIQSSDIGSSAGTESITSSAITILNSRINSTLSCEGTSTFNIFNCRMFKFTDDGSSSGTISNCYIDSSSSPTITHNSTGTMSLNMVSIRCLSGNAIDGTGSGQIFLNSTSFLVNSGINASISINSSTTFKSSFFTSVGSNLFVGSSTSSLTLTGTNTTLSTPNSVINLQTSTGRKNGIRIQDQTGSTTQWFAGRSYIGGGTNNGFDFLQGDSINAMSLTANANVVCGSRLEPSSTSLLGLVSTTKAFTNSRMTTTQKNAITSLVAGMQVYDTDLAVLAFYNGTTWKNIIFDSGTYTPTFTNVSNFNAGTSSTALHHYMRIGNEVTVTGNTTATFSGSHVDGSFGLSLPIPSNFTTVEDCRGNGFAVSASSPTIGNATFTIADSTNDRIQIAVNDLGTSLSGSLVVTYEVKYTVK